MVTRTGSLKPIDVPIDILNQLNSGAIETVNLAECLAVDFTTLYCNSNRSGNPAINTLGE
jgi:hypothetical protein